MAACSDPILRVGAEQHLDFVQDKTRIHCDTCGWEQGVENERLRRMDKLKDGPVRFMYLLHETTPRMPQRWEGDDG